MNEMNLNKKTYYYDFFDCIGYYDLDQYFKTEVLGRITESTYEDWIYDGEDEYPMNFTEYLWFESSIKDLLI